MVELAHPPRAGGGSQFEAARFVQMLESLSDPFYTLDREWRYCYLNAAAERILRVRREDVLGRTVWEVFPDARDSPLCQAVQRAMQAHIPVELEQFHAPHGGWFDVRIVPCTEGLSVCFRDVTALHQSREALRASEERFCRLAIGASDADLTANRRTEEKLREQAALLDNAADAIIVRDLDDRVVYWNTSAERLHGFSADAACGESFAELLVPPPAAYAAAREAVLLRGAWIGELPLVAKGGESVVVESRWTLMRDRHGVASTILTFNTDISQRKRLEQQYLRAQRMESIGELAGGIAHDLNNVLSPIMLAIEFLQQSVHDPASRETLALIGDCAERGASIVERVRSLACGREAERSRVSVARVVHEAAMIARETFPRNISIVEELSPDLGALNADATQLEQALLNLAVNARDAMPSGGTLTIRGEKVLIDAQYASMNFEAHAGAHVKLEVEDTGTGIPADIIARIYDPFFTTKAFESGTGLGLTTTQSIVQSHGGFLRVNSEPGVGTCFRIYLPSAVDGAPAATTTASEGLPRGRGETVLVVDDEESIRLITKQTLEAFGYRVLLAADGSEAISVFAKHQKDIAVLLTDVMMPVIDGPATVRVLRRLNPTLRVIATSGLSTRERPPMQPEDGVDHFLSKPYTAQALLSMLAQLLTEPV